MRWMISLVSCLTLFLFVPGCPTTPPVDDDDDNDDSAGDDDDDTGDDDTGDDDTGGDPMLTTDPVQMDFGQVCVGEPSFRPLRLINDGTGTLIVTGQNSDIPPLGIEEFVGEIEPGDNGVVGVTAACAQPNPFEGVIHIFSNDPTSPDYTVPVNYLCVNC